MSIWVFALLCVAGGAGAAVRFVVDALIRAAVSTRFPVATVAINLTGSFVLGLLAGAALHHDLATAYAVLGTGFLGGFTTFSTYAVETARLALNGARDSAVLNALGTLVGAIAVAYGGLLLGAAL